MGNTGSVSSNSGISLHLYFCKSEADSHCTMLWYITQKLQGAVATNPMNTIAIWAANDDNVLLILGKLLYAITYDRLIGISRGYHKRLCSECSGIRKALYRLEFQFPRNLRYLLV